MINILWVTNFLLPEAASQIEGTGEIKGTGGWILSLANSLCSNPEVMLSIVSITPFVNKLIRIQGERITYFAIPYGKGDERYNAEYESAYRHIDELIKPDVVHIHGSEYPHSLAALNAFGADRTIVTIQGLVSVISSYYLGGLSCSQALLNMTFRDILRGSLLNEQRKMKRRGEYEIRLIQGAQYIGGRTSWDRENIWSINANAFYFNCGEILRDEFYFGKWTYEMCRPHSIFMSQASYPIKGLHQVLEALSIVKLRYPDVQLRVAGQDITYNNGKLMDRVRITSYGRIIRKMIKKYHLSDSVCFTGPLSAVEMKREYLQSNVFVCSSIIENSPNSLGEAQILGVPCVASYVGGVMDMMKGDESNLYRFEETGMLAAKICRLFELKDAIDTSQLREVAQDRHSIGRVTNELLETYKAILLYSSDGTV